MKFPSSPTPGSKPNRAWSPPALPELPALLPQFQFLALLGRSGLGAVYKATQLSLIRSVAVKVLPTFLIADAEAHFTARFRQDSAIMVKLLQYQHVGTTHMGYAKNDTRPMISHVAQAMLPQFGALVKRRSGVVRLVRG